jgi:hypothetical protein
MAGTAGSSGSLLLLPLEDVVGFGDRILFLTAVVVVFEGCNTTGSCRCCSLAKAL